MAFTFSEQVCNQPNSVFQFAKIQVASEIEADHLIHLSKMSQLKLYNQMLNVSIEMADEPCKGSANDPGHYYECPPEKNPCNDNVMLLCQSLRSHFVQQSRRPDHDCLPGGWCDGGSLAVSFHKMLHTRQGNQSSDKAKEQFKKARADAMDQKYIELGRRLKHLSPGADAIEVVGWNCDANRYAGEIYIRLTEKGLSFTERDGVGNVVKTLQTLQSTVNLFVLGLPVGTDVRNLVTFLETAHNCGIRRAELNIAKQRLCSAHVELTNAHDASKILELASGGNGIHFKGRRLSVTPDIRIPSFIGTDLTRFYEASANIIPATIVSIPHTNESCSVSTGDHLLSETQSQLSTEDSQFDNITGGKDECLLCSVIYDQCISTSSGLENANFSQWKAMRSIGSDVQSYFRKFSKGSSDEIKHRFKVAREISISQGLVEMGRRDLRSPTKDIILVPFHSFGQGSTCMNLSQDTYLRLTGKGIQEAALSSLKGSLGLSKSKVHKSKNVFLSNLPASTEIRDLVKYLEHTYNVTIRRASFVPRQKAEKCAFAHVEFQTDKDHAVLASVARNRSLLYGGMAVCLRTDRSIPDWKALNTRYIYERKVIECDEDLLKVADNDRDGTVNNSMDTAGITDDSSDADAIFETTNILFGDKLAMLYAQGQQKTSSQSCDVSNAREAMLNESRFHADNIKRSNIPIDASPSRQTAANAMILRQADPVIESPEESEVILPLRKKAEQLNASPTVYKAEVVTFTSLIQELPLNNAASLDFTTMKPMGLSPIHGNLWSQIDGPYSPSSAECDAKTLVVPSLEWLDTGTAQVLAPVETLPTKADVADLLW